MYVYIFALPMKFTNFTSFVKFVLILPWNLFIFLLLIVGVIQFPLHQLLKWHKGNNLQSRWEFIQRPFRCMHTFFYFWCARINGNEWMKCVGQIKKKENTHTWCFPSGRKPLSTFTLCSCNMTRTVDCIYSDVQKRKKWPLRNVSLAQISLVNSVYSKVQHFVLPYQIVLDH